MIPDSEYPACIGEADRSPATLLRRRRSILRLLRSEVSFEEIRGVLKLFAYEARIVDTLRSKGLVTRRLQRERQRVDGGMGRWKWVDRQYYRITDKGRAALEQYR